METIELVETMELVETIQVPEHISDKETYLKNLDKYLNEVSELTKSEFIDGKIVIHSPACEKHIYANGNIHKVLSQYVSRHNLGVVTQEKAAVVMPQGGNIYEPDLCFFSNQTIQQSLFGNRKLFPVPDIVIEILSESSVKRDRRIKFNDYSKNQVKEYWIVDTDLETVELWILDNDTYILSKIFKDKEVITSSVIKNLKIPIHVFFSIKMSSEYIEKPFVQKIKKQKVIIDKKNEELTQQEKVINQKEKVINKTKKELTLKEKVINQKEEVINKTKKELTLKEEIINQKEEVINKTKKELTLKEEVINQKEEVINKTKEELTLKDDLISELKRKLEELQNKKND